MAMAIAPKELTRTQLVCDTHCFQIVCKAHGLENCVVCPPLDHAIVSLEECTYGVDDGTLINNLPLGLSEAKVPQDDGSVFPTQFNPRMA